MAEQTERTTGNDPLTGVDPGGTRPAPKSPKSGDADKPAVQTGDQNDNPRRP